jgi:MFS family permease
VHDDFAGTVDLSTHQSSREEREDEKQSSGLQVMPAAEDGREPEGTEVENFNEAPASYNIILSVGMMMLFASYLGMQNYLTSVVGKPGYDALAIIFALFGIGNLFASAMIGFMGHRLALIIGAWAHLAVVLAAALAVTDKNLVWLLYPGAAICGIGASFLWAAHGAYVAGLVPNHKLGDAFGVFFTIFGFNEIFGFGLILALNLSAEEQVNGIIVPLPNATATNGGDDGGGDVSCDPDCIARAKLFLWVLVGVAIAACMVFFFVRCVSAV